VSGERVTIESSWPKGGAPCTVKLALEVSPLDGLTGSTKETLELAIAAAEGAMVLAEGAKVTITYEELEDE
jgi:hypothetical protein